MRVRRFGDQDYDKLKKNCAKKNSLFVDTLFPPTNASLFLEQGRSSDIVWKRPAELHENPHLFVEGASPNDVTQGTLGNCWFVSACSALTHNTILLDKVIPDAEKQEWDPRNVYSGIFRFRFWRFGEWVELVVDDLLPTKNGKLIFARSKTPNEFWSALLEKAFAKLYGCYENLVGGHLSDALQDVSGGVAETINIARFLNDDYTDSSGKLFANLRTAFDSKALIVAAIAARTKEEIEQSLDCGLVKGHAYAVTAVKILELESGSRLANISNHILGSSRKQKLIRLQNPWGEKEWNGAWSDNSREWDYVSERQKREMGITVDEDGEFWMPWENFVQYFTYISLCQLMNTNVFSLHERYSEQIFFGEWSTHGVKSGAPNDRAGGCLKFAAAFCSNPQYLFDVEQPNTDIMFALTQKDLNEGQKRRDPYITIGLHLMKVDANRKHRVHQPMQQIAISDYVTARSVFMHLRSLDVGRYVLLPTTYAPKEQTSYMLRIYSPQKVKLSELTKHAPKAPLFGCSSSPTNIIRIAIERAVIDIAVSEQIYCILHSEHDKFRTQSVTVGAQWDAQYIFHKSSKRIPFRIDIWKNTKFARDELLCSAELTVLVDNDCRPLQLSLLSPQGRKLGILFVAVSAYDDPMYL